MSTKFPFIRQTSWSLLLLQFVALTFAFSIVVALAGPQRFLLSIIVGVAIILVYSFGSRIILLADFNRGIACVKRGEYDAAIPHFETSYAFLTKHSWIDRFRAIVLMMPSAMPYREMALANIAFCYVQLGHADNAKASYETMLDEFPNSVLAKMSLSTIATFEKNKEETTDTEANPVHD